MWLLSLRLRDDESSIATSDPGESSSESDTAHIDLSSSSLAADLQQYELMQNAYQAVGLDFERKKEFIGSEYHKLLETRSGSPAIAPCETFHPLQKC